MKHVNSHLKNSKNDENNLFKLFNDLNCLDQPAAGCGDYQTFSEDFHEKDLPMNIGERTRLMLTHPNHMVTQFNKSFISMEVEFEIQLENEFLQQDFGEVADDAEKAFTPYEASEYNYIFVGFKNAAEIISECKFYNRGELIKNYNQNEMVRESYAFNTSRPYETLLGTTHSHSLWENVIKMSPNVAGTFIPLNDLLWKETGKPTSYKVKLDLLIPYTDQLALQNWRLYPNYVLGDMVEEIQTSLEGLVWCQVPPEYVAKMKKRTSYDKNKVYSVPENLTINNHFVQIGEEGRIVSKIEEADDYSAKIINDNTFYSERRTAKDKVDYNIYTIGNNSIIVKPRTAKINVGRTNCVGFGLKLEVAEALTNDIFRSKEIKIPCLELRRFMFEQTPTERGLNVNRILPIHNATNILLVFPRTLSDRTVYQNITYKNIQFLIDKVAYPYNPYKFTFDGRFVQLQLMSYELDNMSATPELIESLSMPLNEITPGHDENHDYPRLKTPAVDNTNFSINIQLERGNMGDNFEGTTTKGHHVVLELHGEPVAEGKFDSYSYPYYKADGTIDEARKTGINPEMWIFTYCYWSWDLEHGVRYHQDLPTTFADF